MPKSVPIPLTNSNYYEEISKKDIKIKNIDDDLNITSNNGRKIFYRFKETNFLGNKKTLLPSISANNFYASNRRNKEETSLGKFSLKNIINQLNDDLREIKQQELDRKKSFIKDKFFSTQIYINRIFEK